MNYVYGTICVVIAIAGIVILIETGIELWKHW